MCIQSHIQAYTEHLLYAQLCAQDNEDYTAVYETWFNHVASYQRKGMI